MSVASRYAGLRCLARLPGFSTWVITCPARARGSCSPRRGWSPGKNIAVAGRAGSQPCWRIAVRNAPVMPMWPGPLLPAAHSGLQVGEVVLEHGAVDAAGAGNAVRVQERREPGQGAQRPAAAGIDARGRRSAATGSIVWRGLSAAAGGCRRSPGRAGRRIRAGASARCHGGTRRPIRCPRPGRRSGGGTRPAGLLHLTVTRPTGPAIPARCGPAATTCRWRPGTARRPSPRWAGPSRHARRGGAAARTAPPASGARAGRPAGSCAHSRDPRRQRPSPRRSPRQAAGRAASRPRRANGTSGFPVRPTAGSC